MYSKALYKEKKRDSILKKAIYIKKAKTMYGRNGVVCLRLTKQATCLELHPRRYGQITPTFLGQMYYTFYWILVITYVIHLFFLFFSLEIKIFDLQEIFKVKFDKIAKGHNLEFFKSSITLLFTDGLFLNFECYLIIWYSSFPSLGYI